MQTRNPQLVWTLIACAALCLVPTRAGAQGMYLRDGESGAAAGASIAFMNHQRYGFGVNAGFSYRGKADLGLGVGLARTGDFSAKSIVGELDLNLSRLVFDDPRLNIVIPIGFGFQEDPTSLLSRDHGGSSVERETLTLWAYGIGAYAATSENGNISGVFQAAFVSSSLESPFRGDDKRLTSDRYSFGISWVIRNEENREIFLGPGFIIDGDYGFVTFTIGSVFPFVR